MKKTFPEFKTDAEAEHFVDTADLSEYDFSDFKPVKFQLGEQVAHIDLDVPQSLLDAVQSKAAARGMSHAHYIRELMERDISHS